MAPVQKVGWGPVVVYPHVSATVLSEVSVGGKPVSEGSVVGAFVGEELRGEHEVVLANGRSYATLNVNLTGRERVTFRIREAASGKGYRVARVMELGLGERYGSAEALLMLDGVKSGTRPVLRSITAAPFSFRFDTELNRSYSIEGSVDLKAWEVLEQFKSAKRSHQFNNPRDNKFPHQYYRVRVE